MINPQKKWDRLTGDHETAADFELSLTEGELEQFEQGRKILEIVRRLQNDPPVHSIRLLLEIEVAAPHEEN